MFNFAYTRARGKVVRENLRAKICFIALKIPDGDMLSGERSSGEKVIGVQLEKSAIAQLETKLRKCGEVAGRATWI